MGENELNDKLAGFDEVKADASPEATFKPSTVSGLHAAPVDGAQNAAPEDGVQDDASAAGVENAASTMESVAAYTETAIEDHRKKRESKRRAQIVAAVVIAFVAAVYFGGAAWFSGHFLPHSEIGGYDISGMSVDEATALFDQASGDYKLKVEGEGLDFEVSSDDTGLRIDSAKVAQKAIEQNAFWTWPAHFVKSDVQDLTDAMQVTFDEKGFAKFVNKKVKKLNKKASDPTPATIAYDKKSDGFVIVPEELGTKLDSDAVLAKVEEAAFQMETSVEIGEDELLRPDVLQDDERLAKAVDTANSYLGADVQLVLGGKDWQKVDGKLISSWIKLNKDVVPVLDDQAVRDWAGARVSETNTVGAHREFTTPRGDAVSVDGGSYGWQVDYEPFLEQLKAAIDEHTVGELEVPCVQTAASVPDKGGVDFGTRYIDVNLSAQHAVFYDGKDVLWEADFISGSPDGEHNTPTGTYMVNLKESPSTLVGEMTPVTVGKGKNQTVEFQPEYETEVQYWMPFVGNAVGFHDATWQPGFGGSMYMDGYGSHGCVNLSYGDAEALYGIVESGTPVIVHG